MHNSIIWNQRNWISKMSNIVLSIYTYICANAFGFITLDLLKRVQLVPILLALIMNFKPVPVLPTKKM